MPMHYLGPNVRPIVAVPIAPIRADPFGGHSVVEFDEVWLSEDLDGTDRVLVLSTPRQIQRGTLLRMTSERDEVRSQVGSRRRASPLLEILPRGAASN